MGMNQMNMGDMDQGMDPADRMRKVGDRIDFEIESIMAIELPEGRFSERMLNKLVDTINKFAPMMEFQALDKVDGEQTRFPMEPLQMIMAIAAAAEDAKMSIDIKLDEIEADRDLATLIGQLDKLSNDAKFKKFLTEELFPEDDEPEDRDDDDDKDEPDDDKMDMDFARRM
tara:strand:+ start:272 stop:784 length:513 start_codon:yes stop_codon:yes gene_type:complete